MVTVAVDGPQTQPGSGLTFPWSLAVPPSGADAYGSHGHGGTSERFSIYVLWSDLTSAGSTVLTELLGYSYRDDTTPSNVRLRRVLPWRHPLYAQLYCTRITQVSAVDFRGNVIPTLSPLSTVYVNYRLAILGLEFTRPLYRVLPDKDVPVSLGTDNLGNPVTFYEEWVRYTDINWSQGYQILSREGMSFTFQQGNAVGKPAGPGSAGQVVAKQRYSRTWHQLPHACLFDANDRPTNVFYNPSTALASPTLQVAGTVNIESFMGMAIGTALCEPADLRVHDLPVPPELMRIVGENFPVQWNVTFNFTEFIPGVGTGVTVQGHNCLPWSADGRWYPAVNRTAGKTVTDATNADPIVITTGASHGYAVGDIVYVTGVTGNTNANGTWIVQTVPSATTFSIDAVGNGAFGGVPTVVGGPGLFRYSDFRYLFKPT